MTGYVHQMIDNNQDFRQFALSCARAFGALIHMRDERMDAQITYPEVSDYHEKALSKAQEELKRLLAMNDAEREAHGVNLRTNAITSMERTVREQSEKYARCRRMLAQVEAWEPPTEEHCGLKEFMREQLLTSIGSGEVYWTERLDEMRAQGPQEYYKEAVRRARWDVEYHTKEMKNERERVAERIEWIRALEGCFG